MHHTGRNSEPRHEAGVCLPWPFIGEADEVAPFLHGEGAFGLIAVLAKDGQVSLGVLAAPGDGDHSWGAGGGSTR